MKPYRPSQKITPAGLTWLTATSIVGGVAIGTLTHFIALLVYLIILFPLAMGFAGGMAIALGVQKGKVRNPAIAGFFGVLTGAILYSTMHIADYWHFQRTAAEEINKELGQANNAPADQLLDAYLQEQTGSTGFLGYIKYSAQQGVSIGRVGSRGFNLGETGTWIYWALEFGAICSMTGALAYFAARNPFCETCDQWYADKHAIGSVPPPASEQFLSLLNRDELIPAGKLINPLILAQPPYWTVQQQSCATCATSDTYLTVDRLSLDHKGNLDRREMVQGLLTASEYQQLQTGITANFATPQDDAALSAQMALAQQERAVIGATDTFAPHELSPSQVADLAQQLTNYTQVKTAYLVRKQVEHFPEHPFYILGILYKGGLLEAKDAETKLVSQLTETLTLPGPAIVISINKDKGMTRTLEQVAGSEIYTRA